MLLSRRFLPSHTHFATFIRVAIGSTISQRVPNHALKHATRSRSKTTTTMASKRTARSAKLDAESPKDNKKAKSAAPADADSHKKLPSKRLTYSRSELGHTTTARAKEVDLNTPYDQIQEALEAQEDVEEVIKVVHWFHPKDLRIQDNTALHHASTLAQEAKKPLICIYLNCAADESWHGTSAARVDFMCEGLKIMQTELKALNIPLVFLECDDRKDMVSTVVSWLRSQRVSHVFGNYEYEIDELRRDLKLVRTVGNGVQVSLHHDQTVVEPGSVLTGTGTPMKVFTPFFREWLETLKTTPELLDEIPAPAANPSSMKSELKDLFDTPAPSPAKDKQFSSAEDKKRIRALWPPGHAAASKRMTAFLKHIPKYGSTRVNPAKDSTSRLSPYFSAGMYSVRSAIRALLPSNKSSTDFSEAKASPGVYAWVRELVFRELYRQTTMCMPHSAMNLPQNLKFTFVNWEDDEENWEKWVQGRTGEPFIDAGMRQLAHEGWMHNRLRMNVSSYLYCNLLLNPARGERYFAETLIDWDLSNNTQGWEPSYTVFNPVSQAERNDPEGEYIRRWVPELKGVVGKAVFAPHARLGKKAFEALGYPAPCVDWKETKQRCLERFKEDMAGVEP